MPMMTADSKTAAVTPTTTSPLLHARETAGLFVIVAGPGSGPATIRCSCSRSLDQLLQTVLAAAGTLPLISSTRVSRGSRSACDTPSHCLVPDYFTAPAERT